MRPERLRWARSGVEVVIDGRILAPPVNAAFQAAGAGRTPSTQPVGLG